MKRSQFLIPIIFLCFIFYAIPALSAFSSDIKPTLGLVYSCPMHPNLRFSRSGNCPKCGMKLIAIGYYSCPMHPRNRYSSAGNCPICGMKLVFHRLRNS